MKPRGLMISAGGFSLINESLRKEFPAGMPDYEIESFHAVNDVLRGREASRLLLDFQALLHFAPVILKSRIPPRDLIVRLPAFQRLLQKQMPRTAQGCAFTFQTQSLFDASCPGVPHYLYTDHTFEANRRYNPPRKTWPASPAWKLMERQLYAKCQGCFTLSRFAADSIVEDYGVDPARVHVVGSGCNIELPETEPPRDRIPRRVLFLGVEWERKGGPLLVNAMDIVRKTFSDATLDVVGCDPGLSHPGVRCHGRVSKEQVGRYLLEADILCLPSHAEPSAAALVEGSGFGMPVVATRVGGSPERVLDGQTGLLVDAGDAPALASAIRKLMQDPALARRMGSAGHRFVMENYSWTATVRRIAKVISAERQ